MCNNSMIYQNEITLHTDQTITVVTKSTITITCTNLLNYKTCFVYLWLIHIGRDVLNEGSSFSDLVIELKVLKDGRT